MAIGVHSRSVRLAVMVTLAAAVLSGCGRDDQGDTDFGVRAGARLAVVGVQYDATLPLRSSPGADHPMVGSPGPLADDLIATGGARRVDSSIWYEVTADGVTGWADATSLAYLGATSDATARIVGKLGGPPAAASMLELGRIVASAVSPEPPPAARVTVTAAPTQGDVGEVTYDVLGFPDDSVAGERLHVSGTLGDKFTLKSVEATTLCRRGVTDDSRHLCV